MDNKNIVDFLGYHLKTATFNRDIKSRGIKIVKVIVSDKEWTSDDKYRLEINVKIELLDGLVSNFIYSALFHINDRKMFEDFNKESNYGIAQLFSIVFPYIRASIHSITNDSLPSIDLPVFNISEVDVCKEIIFSSKPINKTENLNK